MDSTLPETGAGGADRPPEPGRKPDEGGPARHETLDDGVLRLLGVPGFGVVIPNAAGLFGPLGPGDGAYWVGYVWFIALAAAIWHGNRYLLFAQRRHLDWFSHPIQKIVLLLFAIVCFTAPLTVGALVVWYRAVGLPVDLPAIEVTTLANVVCVVFVTHVYETAFLVKERSTDMVQLARVERARTQAQLDALRTQIDPHFLFNSLNTLSFLIDTSADKARAYTETLARVYRYILMHRERDLVPLADELSLVDDYFFLLELRFGAALSLRFAGRQEGAGAALAVPMSVQTLVENAVKHNVFSVDRPLVIDVEIGVSDVTVSHPLRPKQIRASSKVGLHNLDMRHNLVLGASIRVERGERFCVTLPIASAA